MSDYENKRGKLVPMYRDVCCSLAEKCRKLANEKGWDIEEYYDYKEMIAEEGYKTHHIFNGQLFEIISEDIDPYSEIAEGVIMPDGSIEFVLRWYNGGACMHKMLDDMNVINNQGERNE